MSGKSMIAWRKNNPLKASYQALKDNAKRRGKLFDITFEEFKEFAIKTDYINKRGRSAQSFHIDRVGEKEGYTKSNIQALPNVDNVKKYVKFKYRDEHGAAFHTVTVKQDDRGDAPF